MPGLEPIADETPQQTAERIRAFWDGRAQQFGTSQRATLNETYLRHVEITQMRKQLLRRRPRRVLDVGCGNGYSTRLYAAALPDTQFFGVDFSPQMIELARQDAPGNVRFSPADVTDPATLPVGSFDVIYTQRCIQNLPDYPTQQRAIRTLRSRLTPGGTLILNECSRDGVAQLNGLRRKLGLAAIENIEPWHNTFMIDRRLRDDFGARVRHISSTYMMLTKVLHKRLGKWARYLPPVGRFGYDRFYLIGPTAEAGGAAEQLAGKFPASEVVDRAA
jgi:SAM-dependent methyltransferase